MKKISALILACLVCCSCGQDNPADDVTETTTEAVTETVTEEVFDFVGKWQGVKFIEDGEELDIFDDIPIYACYQFELCEDGSVKLGETTSEIADHENSWRWNRTSSGTQIEFYDSEDDYYDVNILTFDGDYLVYEESDSKLYMEKVDEFTPYQPVEETTEKTTHEYISADPTAFTGKWETRKLTVKKDKSYLMSEPLMEICQLEIYDDYTAVISGVEISGSENPVTYTWGIVSETEIELVDDNGNIVFFTMDGDYLVCNENNITVSLGRVDEFTPKESEDVEDSAITPFVGKWQSSELIINEDKHYLSEMPVSEICHIAINDDYTAVISGKEITGSENPVKYKCNDVSENRISLVDEDGNTVLLDYAEECFLYMDDDITVILKSVDEFTVIDPDFYRYGKIN